VSDLISGLPTFVAGDEEVARSLTSSSHVAPGRGRIKHNAYLPAPDDDTSVFRCSGRSVEELHALIPEERRTRHGAAVVKAEVIREAGVDVIAEEPPPRHANIRGWLRHADPDEQKARRKEIAKIIAESARHVTWP
jgi:hypothetical protein